MKSLKWSFVTLSFVGFMVGCNTIEGVGRDVERLGDAIEDSADDARDRRRGD